MVERALQRVARLENPGPATGEIFSMSASFGYSEDNVSSGTLSGYGTLTLDDEWATPTMPFSVFFEGVSCNTIRISSNGWIEFGGQTASAPSNDCLPTSEHPKPFLAADWDDLVPTVDLVQYGYVGTAPNRTYIVSWDAYVYPDSGKTLAFQVQIHEGSGLINVGTSGSNPGHSAAPRRSASSSPAARALRSGSAERDGVPVDLVELARAAGVHVERIPV